eukprot:CAMPEP_0196592096 /NCGR_PEP_ID=MMETSP1081-20130531/71737_1 /TAXON_ID=36882 /ORGANISM="Pyramimonas amylifera, Strain CCMP720" /LENGTH=240 /DNA_ID=CAMNT_0041915675 /DNA_START=242 /DNA_END=964 /DNA_ORIENTATION=-
MGPTSSLTTSPSFSPTLSPSSSPTPSPSSSPSLSPTPSPTIPANSTYSPTSSLSPTLSPTTLTPTTLTPSPLPSTSSPTPPPPTQINTNASWAPEVQALLDQSDFAGAVAALLAVDPKDSDTYNMLGYSYRSLTPPDYVSAESSYMQALELKNDNCGAREYLGEMYLAQDEFALANAQLALIKELCPDGIEGPILEAAIAVYNSSLTTPTTQTVSAATVFNVLPLLLLPVLCFFSSMSAY